MLCDTIESVGGPQKTVTRDGMSWPGQVLSVSSHLPHLPLGWVGSKQSMKVESQRASKT